MNDEFRAFDADLDLLIRACIARKLRFPAAASQATSLLRGRRVEFYSNAWLGYLELEGSAKAPEPVRYFFVAQQRRKKVHVVPVANLAGCVQRVNRELGLSLARGNIVEYLNFYYCFTPKDDAMLARLGRGPTQFAVPRTFAEIEFRPQAQLALEFGPGIRRGSCSVECLARGAVWHFLDEPTHERVLPLRLRKKQSAISGRLPIQFRDALFATDFRVPRISGAPLLSNPELLFESDALVLPKPTPTVILPLPRKISWNEFWVAAKTKTARVTATWGRHALRAFWWIFAAVLLYVWLLTALFSVFEWFGSRRLRAHVQWVSDGFGVATWPETFFAVAATGIAMFLLNIFVATHMDKVFNWIFRLCPRRIQPWLAQVLDRGIEGWDQRMTAQDTFGKRLGWATVRLALWTAYLVLGFATLQIVWDIIWDLRTAPMLRLIATLLSQAVLNIPFVTFLLIRVFGLGPRLDPVADGIVDAVLLAAFQFAMALVVFKGLYRVWIFTVEASPYTFFRRLRQRRGRGPQERIRN
jgi:hypothetical protein